MAYDCKITELPLQHTLSVRVRTPVGDLPQHFGRVYGAVFQYLAELGVPPAGEPFGAYYNMDMQDLDVEIGVAVPQALPPKGEVQPGIIPAGRFVFTEHTGPYDGVGPAYEALAAYADAQGVEPTGVAYEYYLNDPSQEPYEEPRTRIVYPVR
jgi:effector-binding domain-containing protein